MEKLSMKTVDIGLQTAGKPNSAVQAGDVSGDFDFKKMIQNKSEDAQGSQSKQDGKEISKDQADKTEKTDRTEKVDDKKQEGVSGEKGKTDKAGNSESDTSQAEAMIAAQILERFSYGFTVPEQETAVQTAAEAPEVSDIVSETIAVELMTAADTEEAAAVQMQPETEVRPEQMPEIGLVQQPVQPKQNLDRPEQVQNTAETDMPETMPVVQETVTSETKQQAQDFSSAPKETADTSRPEEHKMAEPDDLAAGHAAAATAVRPETANVERPEIERPETMARVYVEQPEELPEKVTDTLLAKLVEGVKEFEIHIEPVNLGKIAVKVLYEGNQATISIVCSEKRAMDALSQNAREIGSIIDRNLGGETTIIVEKQETDYLNQTRDENEQAGQNAKQQKEEKGQNKDSEDAEQFLQKLRLGLVGK